MHTAVVERLGGDPSLKARVPFSICNSSKVTYAIKDTVIKNNRGWTLRGSTISREELKAAVKDGPRTLASLNHVRSLAHQRRGEPHQGSVLARWGGLGSHRSPVGFSFLALTTGRILPFSSTSP